MNGDAWREKRIDLGIAPRNHSNDSMVKCSKGK